MFSDFTVLEWATIARAYAVTAGVVFAVIMLSVCWRNHLRTQQLRREAEAKRIYASYLLQAMQHPELARPDRSMRPRAANAHNTNGSSATC